MKSRPYHPYLLALYPVFSLFARNFGETAWTSLVAALFIALGIASVFTLPLNRWTHNRDKSAVISSTAIFAFFSYGQIHALILTWYANNFFAKAEFKLLDAVVATETTLHRWLLPLTLLALIAGCTWVKRRSTLPDWITPTANRFAVILLALPLLSLLPAARAALVRRQAIPISQTSTKFHHVSQTALPDIYCIVLDGYGRADALSRHYGFDNGPFIKHLESRGFYVAARSRANYEYTFLSLPSLLNMTHLLDLARSEGADSTDLSIPYQMIRENEVTKRLKSKGYQYIHMNSTWAATRRSPLADRSIGYQGTILSDDFLRVLGETSLLKPFMTRIDHRLADIHLHALKELKSIPLIQAPTFTFAHFLPPHYPYIFDKDGNVINERALSRQFSASEWDKKDLYIGQVAFMNKEISKLIDYILDHSQTPPVIILLSDHGPKAGENLGEYLHARMSNLAAFHLPSRSQTALYPTITPVNYFRVLLRNDFGDDLPPLPDDSFISGRMNTPFALRQLADESAYNPPAPLTKSQ